MKRQNIGSKYITGIVLATNLIMLLLVTLVATSLYKNSFVETKMANQQLLKLQTENSTKHAYSVAKLFIEDLILMGSDLESPRPGYFPYKYDLSIATINWSDSSSVIKSSNDSKFIIIYLGDRIKNYGNENGIKHHLFKIILFKQLGQGSKHIEQSLFSLVVA